MIFSGLLDLSSMRCAQVEDPLENQSDSISDVSEGKYSIDEYSDKIEGDIKRDIAMDFIGASEAFQSLEYALNHLRWDLRNKIKRI